ncbi:MAG: ASKHA domain-containing protein [Desulfobacteraceae bacterium]|jgi:uncharacterized 2Fe-2S/4Fe-4S cluster protein (DUF4445 family)
MESHTVRFLPHDRSVGVKHGETLIRAALEAGVHINASCGGDGVCGKCRILVEEGAVEGGRSEMVSRQDVEKGYRLACKATVCGDVVIRIPVESEMDAFALKRPPVARHTAGILQPALETPPSDPPYTLPVEKIYIELPPPAAGDNVPDVTRIVSALRQQHHEHRLAMDLELIRKLPDILRQADFKVTVTLLRPVQAGRKNHIIDLAPGDTTHCHLALAVDIGTTTVQARLIDQTTGKALCEGADFNAQISYGEDVISRIITAQKADGLEKLHAKIAETINGISAELLKKADAEPGDVTLVVLAGNTTMTQLMLKINPRHIRLSPYVPAGSIYPPVKAKDVGLNLGEQTRALFFPQISSYVGGDIVAGVLASGMHKHDDLTLFLDIGTNAEMAIGNKEWLACAACSAGPAFEGGGIQFGMRAAKGAIEDFSINPLTFEPMIVTIGNVRPKGICGSGLITMVATLFEAGVIDSSGKFQRELKTRRIRQTNDVWEYVLAWREATQIDRDIVLTEIDIENLIRAKGAIYSGCRTLLDEIGTPMEAIDRIVLAGGFGSYIDLEKAMTIGLLPEIDPAKVVFMGNSSLLGAQFCALSNHLRGQVVDLTAGITNFELSETHSYMDHYVAALFLPHTDLGRFPKLKARLENRKTAN